MVMMIRQGRVDDANLDFLNDDETHLVGSAFNEFETAVHGNLLFHPSESLRTIDWCRRGQLLPLPDDTAVTVGRIDVRHHAHGQLVGVMDGLLTAPEVDQIRSIEWTRQHFHYNRGDRVICIDDDFADLLWKRLRVALEDLPTTVAQPLGFGVKGTQWKIDGVNPAMRINTYQASQIFAPHRDAQFCESRRRRSVLSLIIYLSDTPGGGETRFYTDLAFTNLPSEPMTVAEEMHFQRQQHSSGSFPYLDVTPVAGRCVLFTHDLIHESLPMVPSSTNTERVVLRTDICARAETEPYFMDRQEVLDYRRSLSFFTEAEQLELQAANYRTEHVREYDPVDETYYQGNSFLNYEDNVRLLNEKCNELYDKSMYLRYQYPRRLRSRPIKKCPKAEDRWIRLGETMFHVMKYLTVQEAKQLAIVYPVLGPCVNAMEADLEKDSQKFEKVAQTVLKELGKDNATNRYYLDFQIKSELFPFMENIEAWCRVAAVLVAYKVSHSCSSDKPIYCARFMPQTGQVVAVPLERLIHDAFFNQKSFGAIYAVRQQDDKVNAQKDFESSVDRGVILRDHGLDFVGQHLAEHFHVRVNPGSSTVRRRLNCVDGIFGGFPSKHSMNVPSASKRPGWHVFIHVDTKDAKVRYGVTHDAGGRWRLTQNPSPNHKREFLMNQMIFDFEKYKFEVRREASWEGIEYVVEISDMMKDIAPFYHASTNHMTIYRGGGSMGLQYLASGGANSPFLDRAGSPSELRVKSKRLNDDTWDIRVEWNGSFFPVTL